MDNNRQFYQSLENKKREDNNGGEQLEQRKFSKLKWKKKQEKNEGRIDKGIPNKKRNKKAIVVVVLVVAIAAGGMFTFQNKGKKAQASGSNMMESKVQKGTLSQSVEGTGTLANADSTDLKIPVGLQIKEIKVSEGDEVKKGDTLATVDKTSLLAALAETQSELDDINNQLGEEADSDTLKYVESSVDGRVKKIYASQNTDAADTVLEKGALMLISLDGKMAVKMDTTISLTVGQKVKVVLSSGSSVTGTVIKSDDESCTITVTDKGTKYHDKVTAYTSSGTKIGAGKLYINKEAKVTATSGTVSSILVSENEYVSEGDNLLKLKGDFQSEEYLSLESEKEDLEGKLASLLKIAKNNTITADAAGIIAAVNISADTESGSTLDSSSASSSSSSSGTSGSSSASSGSVTATGISVTGTSKIVSLSTNVSKSAAQASVQSAIDENEISVNTEEDTESTEGTTSNSSETTTEKKNNTSTGTTTAGSDTTKSDTTNNNGTNSTTNSSSSTQSNSSSSISKKSTTGSQSSNGTTNQNSTDTTGTSGAMSGAGKSRSSMSGAASGASSAGMASGSAGAVSGSTSGSSASSGTSSTDSTSTDANTELTSAFSIASGDEMTLTVNVDEMDILSIETGQKATITFDAIENKEYEGKITSIDKNGTTSNGTTKYPVEITVTKENSMMSGMNASVTITTSEVSDALLVPAAAVTEEGNTSYVYTEKDSKTGELSGKTEVQTGDTDGTNIVITSGLSEGDTIYYSMAAGGSLDNSSTDNQKDNQNGKDMKMNGNFGGGQGGGNGGGTPPSGSPGGSN